jgi:superfamily II DNA or RNA helicase
VPSSDPWQLSLPLRAWQHEALLRWKEEDRGVIAVVTGGGKTLFALACILDLVNRSPDTVVAIVVPTVALLDQWFVVLTEDLHVSPHDIALYGGGHHTAESKRLNVLVLNTARSVAPSIASQHPTFLIVDECHRAASMHNALAMRGHHAATLGLSATPERDFDDLFNQIVVPALGPVIYRYDYNQALADGVITPFALINVRVALRPSEQQKYDQYTRRLVPLFRQRDAGSNVDDHLHRLLQERARVSTTAQMRIPAAVRILEQNRYMRTLVFHEQIYAADVIAQLLRKRGHRVAVYHSGIGANLRQDNLRLFRRGEVDILVTCRALDEGINVPDASLAVIVASTASTRQRIQRLGRVLRPAPNKTHAEIYTIFVSEPEAERLRQEEAALSGVESISWQAFGSGD